MEPFPTYDDLLRQVEAKGVPRRVLGHTPDGAPVVALRGGGEGTPAVFISAGSHATEQAGVSAAVTLLEQLETEHQVHVIPTRDPTGMSGFARVLALGLGDAPWLESVEQLAELLREEGEVVYDEDDTVVSLIGEFGYSTQGLLGRFGGERARLLERLKGRRVFFPSNAPDVAGAGRFERAYTLVVSPGGQLLHLNRFHDTPWAPVEVRCTLRLMAEVRPGICFDLHEAMGIEDRYWLSARRQPSAAGQAREERIAHATIEAIAASGGRFMGDDYSPGSFFERGEPGVFWLDASARGEGLNLMDYAARTYGIAFGTEMGMHGTFDQRVGLGVRTVQAAVAAWEEDA